MDRRRLLAALGTGLVGGLAGCGGIAGEAGGQGSEETVTAVAPPGSTPIETATGDVETGPPGRYGVPQTICQEEPREDHGIYAITDPAFGSWAEREVPDRYRARDATGEGLAADRTVIGLRSDPPRAYPLSVLSTHEVVNDRVRLDGRERPVLVTYCPLCRSGMVADRTVGGEVTRFTVTGLLWQAPRLQEAAAVKDNRTFGADVAGGESAVRRSGNLVMQDGATGSYWSQILAQAICGPEAGAFLTVAPSTVATWGEWRGSHPDTDLLLPPPHSGTTEQ